METNIATKDCSDTPRHRSVQIAPVQMALNVVATNQKQHQVNERSRIPRLNPTPQSRVQEIQLSLPVKARKCSKERDPFEYTKKVAAYQKALDVVYQLKLESIAKTYPGIPSAPLNYNGPFIIVDGAKKKDIARSRLQLLISYYNLLGEAQKRSPRPLLHQMLCQISKILAPDKPSTHEMMNVRLSQQDLDLLKDIGGDPWQEMSRDYNDEFTESQKKDSPPLSKLKEIITCKEIYDQIPLWMPKSATSRTRSTSIQEICAPIPYDPQKRSESALSLDVLLKNINERQIPNLESGQFMQSWTEAEVRRDLEAMATKYCIQSVEYPDFITS